MSEPTAPEAVAPEAVAPEAVASEAVASEAVGSEGVASKAVASPEAPAPTVSKVAGLPTATVRVRFHELDPYGHVNHGVYLNYFETARTEALEALGFGLDALHARGIAIVVVEANVRFHAPAVAGDVLTIETAVAELRPASSWWHQRLLRDAALLAEIDVRAATTTLDGRPTAAPRELRDALAATAPTLRPARTRAAPRSR